MATTTTALQRTEILRAFTGFRSELDEVNDRRERLMKISRDITVASKRVIFHLHRALTADVEPSPMGGEGPAESYEAVEEKILAQRGKLEKKAIEEGKGQLEVICTLWAKVGAELEGQDFWRFAPAM
jgi:hypothetical protein